MAVWQISLSSFRSSFKSVWSLIKNIVSNIISEDNMHDYAKNFIIGNIKNEILIISIKIAYNTWAEQYDTNENKTRDLDKKATIKTLSKIEFENVLELGCGTGKNTECLVKKAKFIIGLDFSEEMLNKAKLKIKTDMVRFQRADLTKTWEIEDNFADLITCSLTLEHIRDLDFIFNQAYQKLKTNGKFFISELHPFKQYSGNRAKYETKNGIEELEVYVHHISEYLKSTKSNAFKLIEINEWFDNQNENEIPRLISFVFTK